MDIYEEKDVHNEMEINVGMDIPMHMRKWMYMDVRKRLRYTWGNGYLRKMRKWLHIEICTSWNWYTWEMDIYFTWGNGHTWGNGYSRWNGYAWGNWYTVHEEMDTYTLLNGYTSVHKEMDNYEKMRMEKGILDLVSLLVDLNKITINRRQLKIK